MLFGIFCTFNPPLCVQIKCSYRTKTEVEVNCLTQITDNKTVVTVYTTHTDADPSFTGSHRTPKSLFSSLSESNSKASHKNVQFVKYINSIFTSQDLSFSFTSPPQTQSNLVTKTQTASGSER